MVMDEATAASPQRQAANGQIDKCSSIRLVPHIIGSNAQRGRFEPVKRRAECAIAGYSIGRCMDRTHEGMHSRKFIGFKSKVVSRLHARLRYDDGSWKIQDIGSSSGTYLNHIRLSPPNMESKTFTLKDGDIIQFGVDYRGGTEEAYQAIKCRVELDRHLQNDFRKYADLEESVEVDDVVKEDSKTENEASSDLRSTKGDLTNFDAFDRLIQDRVTQATASTSSPRTIPNSNTPPRAIDRFRRYPNSVFGTTPLNDSGPFLFGSSS